MTTRQNLMSYDSKYFLRYKKQFEELIVLNKNISSKKV